jgi:hypothetical protein
MQRSLPLFRKLLLLLRPLLRSRSAVGQNNLPGLEFPFQARFVFGRKADCVQVLGRMKDIPVCS